MKKLVLAVLAVLVAVGLFGCGSDKSTGPVIEPEPREYGFLKVIHPPGAEVWIDDKVADKKTPLNLKLEVGDYQLSVYLLDERILNREVTIKEDQEIIIYQIVSLVGTVHVEGSEEPLPGVLIELLDVDGRTVVRTLTDAQGKFELKWQLGAVTFRYSKEGWGEPRSENILLALEQGLDLSLPKTVTTSTLTLQITPPTSEPEVWVNNDSLGSADPSGYFQAILDHGSHEITLIGWGCKEKTVSITLAPGETKSQNISLEVWDLSGEWKRESDDSEVDVTLTNVNELRGLQPVGRFYVKGNRLTFVSSISEAYANGVILEDGKRIEFTVHSNPGSAGSLHIYTKIS